MNYQPKISENFHNLINLKYESRTNKNGNENLQEDIQEK